jgi:hypothetical protein
MKGNEVFDRAVSKFREAQAADKIRKAGRESLERRISEFAQIKTDQENALLESQQKEKDALDACARGELDRTELQAAISNRMNAEKLLSETRALAESLEGQLMQFDSNLVDSLSLAKQAVFRAMFEELKQDILGTCLPKMQQAYIAFHLAGHGVYWMEFLGEGLKLLQPDHVRWHELQQELEKTLE